MTDAAGSPLETLLQVQDLDTAISQLEHRKAALPERRALAELESSLVVLAARAVELGRARDDLARRQAELDAKATAAAGRREALEKRMYSSRGTAARDLAAMDDEIHHLSARQGEIEEAELELMVEQEPIDAELDALGGDRRQLEDSAAELRRALAAAEVDLESELAERRAERAALAEHVPSDLRQRYQALRTRLGGIGAARLVGNRCSGCHLELPAMEVDRIRRLSAGTVIICEQCGRILVPAVAPIPATSMASSLPVDVSPPDAASDA